MSTAGACRRAAEILAAAASIDPAHVAGAAAIFGAAAPAIGYVCCYWCRGVHSYRMPTIEPRIVQARCTESQPSGRARYLYLTAATIDAVLGALRKVRPA